MFRSLTHDSATHVPQAHPQLKCLAWRDARSRISVEARMVSRVANVVTY